MHVASYKMQTITIGDDVYDFKPDNATQSSDGLMSAEDKTKVDNLEAITTEEIITIFSTI